jgi:hypothetical protein
VKVTFEGSTIADLIVQAECFLAATYEKPRAKPAELKEPPAPEPKVKAKTKASPPKPKGRKPGRPPKKVVEKPAEKPVEELVEEPEEPRVGKVFPDEDPMDLDDIELTPKPEPEVLDAKTLAAIQLETTKDLREAYAQGKHKQVLGLLAKFGNGAKSFRELGINDFPPIRKAIDEGALT